MVCRGRKQKVLTTNFASDFASAFALTNRKARMRKKINHFRCKTKLPLTSVRIQCKKIIIIKD
jgi:hypothetical protein